MRLGLGIASNARRRGGGGGSSRKLISIARKVNTYNNGWSAGDANHKNVTYKTRHYANQACSGLYYMYGNWINGADNTNPITIKPKHQKADTSIIPITFTKAIAAGLVTDNGDGTITLQPGVTVLSDLVNVSLAENEQYFELVYTAVDTVGQVWPLGLDHENGSGEGQAQGDATATGVVTTTVHERQYHACAIFAASAAKTDTYAWFGNSITAGGYGGIAYSGKGFPQVACETNKRGALICGLQGELAATAAVTANLKRRYPLAKYADTAIVEYGTNDFNANASLPVATLQGYFTAIAANLRALGVQKVICVTIPPRTTSTDSFATTVNQTPINAAFAAGAGSPRGIMNAWMRGGGGGSYDGYIDLADAVESARDSGVWAVGNTADGIHPLNVAVTSIAAVINLNTIGSGAGSNPNNADGAGLPPVPTGLAATPGSSQVALSWSTSNSLLTVGYNVYKDGVKANTSIITGTSYTVTGLTAGTYSFTVEAVNEKGDKSNQTAPVSASPTIAGTIIASDDFTRADNATSLGNATTGQTWQTINAGVWGISSNTGGLVSNANATQDFAYINTTYSDCSVEAKLVQGAAAAGNRTGVAGRLSATGQGFSVFVPIGQTQYAICRDGTSIAQSAVTPAAGDVLKLVFNGPNIELFVNGVSACSATDSNYISNTRHGLVSHSYGNKFDDFYIKTV